jgi:hypothetical protein
VHTFDKVLLENPKLGSCVFYSFERNEGFKTLEGLKNSNNPTCAVVFILLESN